MSLLKLALVVLIEAIVGITISALVLAFAVPVLIRLEWIAPGDATGAVVIVAALVAGVCALVLRPGSAINRHGRDAPP